MSRVNALPNRGTLGTRRALALVVTIVAVPLSTLVLLWAPWMTPRVAADAVTRAFGTAWSGVPDGCSLVAPGVRAVQRAPVAGYTVTIVYACGMVPSNSPEFHRRAVVYVSPLATIHGLPRP
jgi:hypothetical protein